MPSLSRKPDEPFLFGRGGRRMSPEDIALERRLAAQQMQTGADFSPVQHWTQGLARVANGLAGGLNMRRVDAAAERNAEESNTVLQALMAGGSEGGPDPVVAALTNPNVSEQVRDLATMMWRDQHETPAQPYRQEDNAGNVWELDPASGQFKRIFTDLAERQFIQDGQLVQVPNPYAGGARPEAPQPPPEAVQELLSSPDPAAVAEFNGIFGPGSAEAVIGARQNFTPSTAASGPVITRAQAESMIAEKGKEFFDAWAGRNNVTVGN